MPIFFNICSRTVIDPWWLYRQLFWIYWRRVVAFAALSQLIYSADHLVRTVLLRSGLIIFKTLLLIQRNTASVIGRIDLSFVTLRYLPNAVTEGNSCAVLINVRSKNKLLISNFYWVSYSIQGLAISLYLYYKGVSGDKELATVKTPYIWTECVK